MDFTEFYSLFSSCVLISEEAILIHRYNLYYNFEFVHNFGKKTIEKFCARKNLGLDIGKKYFTIYVTPSMCWIRVEQANDVVNELIKDIYENEIGQPLPDNFNR